MIEFTLSKLVGFVASPFGLAVAGFAILTLTEARRNKMRRIGWLLLGQLFVFSLHPISDPLLGAHENAARELAKENNTTNQASAIVVLGGLTSPTSEPMRPTPDLLDAADRLVHGLRLYKANPNLPIILTGGNLPAQELAESEADSMRKLLIDFGVPPKSILVETRSLNTRQNAEFTRKKLEEASLAPTIYLVTSAFHMRRAKLDFERVGLTVIAAPTDWRIAPSVRPLHQHWTPNLNALTDSSIAIKEWLGLAVQNVRMIRMP